MLTLVLTYRNRDLAIVNRCLNSLTKQTNTNFIVYLVDYGSNEIYSKKLKELLASYTFINYIYVATQGQLWNKSRAINIALQKCNTPYFLMGDIDLLYHPEMIDKCCYLMLNNDVAYFQYGFLSEEETALEKDFSSYIPEFLGNHEVTGTTLYKTEILKSINGYDEFYHGWGAEDTDVHLRLKNAGFSVLFYKDDLLVKHQWHAKSYRNKKSTAPFHTTLEKSNHSYMSINEALGVTQANLTMPWGVLPAKKQLELVSKTKNSIELSNEKHTFNAFLYGILPQLQEATKISIKPNVEAVSFKNILKKKLGKKCIEVLSIEVINNQLLGALITSHRLSSYNYHIDWKTEQIHLSISPYVTT